MYLLHFMLIQKFLYSFFPWPGPGQIAVLPISFLVALVSGILFYFLINFIKSKVKRIVTICLSFLILTYFYMSVYGEDPLYQFGSAIYYSNHFEELKYEDMFYDNYSKYAVKCTAAFAKYKDSIPDAAFVIDYCCNPKKSFYVARYGYQFVTNNTNVQILLSDNNDSITLVENFQGEVYHIKGSFKKFGKESTWGRKMNSSNSENSVYFSDINLSPNEGFCTFYFNLLVD